MIKEEVLKVLNVLYPCKLKNNFESFYCFIQNYKNKSFCFDLRHAKNLKLTFRQVIEDFLISDFENIKAKDFMDLDKNLLLNQLKLNDSVSDALMRIYLNQVTTEIESFKNNFICLIIFIAFFNLNDTLKFSVFNDFIFNEVSKYDLDTNIQEVYFNLIKR